MNASAPDTFEEPDPWAAPCGQDSEWTIACDGYDPLREAARESIFTTTNGSIGCRGSFPLAGGATDPGTFLAGVFDHGTVVGPVPALVRTPDWLALAIAVDGEALSFTEDRVFDVCRMLDLRHGLVSFAWRHRDRAGRITRVRSLHYVSAADRRALVQEVEIVPENYSGAIEVDLRVDGRPALRPETPLAFFGDVNLDAARRPQARLLPVSSDGGLFALRTSDGTILIAEGLASEFDDAPPLARLDSWSQRDCIGHRWSWRAERGATYRLRKLVSVQTSREQPDPVQAAAAHRRTLVSLGGPGLLAAHRAGWLERWRKADIQIAGAPALQRALRFAIYQLAGAADPLDEWVSIGARGLTGTVYLGHVFWDTDIFALPFFVLSAPAAARALLMFRYHTLPAARDIARRLGYAGACYPWESAAGGEDATPRQVVGAGGEVIPIVSGSQEHHIAADVAYAVWLYWQATQDAGFLRAAGAEMLIETARFWCSRAQLEDDGRYHIRGVLGPDEYHENVDDSAYTNVMARANLRWAAELATLVAERWPDTWSDLAGRLGIADDEIVAWETVADRLVDGLDPHSGLIEQFAGYEALEDLDLARLEPRQVPLDVLLGYERVQRVKAIKQADVIMALHLLWEQFTPEQRAANFAYYEPRTGHGSSLSPGIHAAVAARLGALDLAERYLQQTAAIDLDDRMGNAAGGVHLAALASLWQAVIFGFVGVEIRADCLLLCPRLASSWRSLRCSLTWRGRTVAVTLDAEPAACTLHLQSGAPLRIAVNEHISSVLQAGETFRYGQLGVPVAIREEG